MVDMFILHKEEIICVVLAHKTFMFVLAIALTFTFGFSSQDLYTFVLSIANLTKFISQHPFVLAIVLAHKACVHSPCLLPRTHKTCSILQIFLASIRVAT